MSFFGGTGERAMRLHPATVCPVLPSALLRHLARLGTRSTPEAFSLSPGFGAPAASSPFGQTQPTNVFGQAATGSSFAFNAASSASSLFGAGSSPAFGATPGSTFGFGAPAAPSPFGQPQASTFGAAPSFGSPGGFGGGAAATAGRGTRGVPWRKTQEQDGAANGPKTTAPASAPSVFGAASAPAFGSQSPSPFGGGGFGVASTPAFGQAASSPAFGSTSVFGGAPQQQTSAFGATSTFGTTQAPAFGAAASAPAFGGFGTPAASAPAFGGFGAPPAASAPAQRGPAGFSPGGGGWGYAASPPPRIPALAVPRTLTPRPGSRMRPGRAVSHLGASGRGAAAGPEATPSPRSALPGPAASPGAGMFAVAAATSPCDARGSSATPDAPAPGGLFAPRDDPRRLFVRDALPSTAAGAGPGFVAGVLPAPRTPRPAPGEGGAGVSPAAKRGGSGAADDRADVANGDAGDNSAAAASPHSAHRPDSDPDATLAGLLPRLTRPDYYTFVVGRRGLGSVAWLEPVDVRGLDLDDVITISRGGVEVYLEGPAKPPVGAGLNRPAEVTMLKIFKTDKATGQPVTNAAAVESFTRKLKRVTAEQGAQFVSYDPRTGTWRFTVEHFSRYGLFDDEDDDEDDEEGRSGDHGAGVGQEKPTPVGPASARRGRRRQVVDSDGEGGSPGAADPDSPRGLAGARPPPSAGLGLAWEEDDEEEREDMQQSDGASVSGEASDESFGGALARFVPGGRAQDFGGAPTLVTSLPARVGASEPEDLQRIGPEELALASPGLAEMPGPRRVPTGPATAQGHTRCRVGAHPVTPAADAADRADPARWLGRSWRAGWAPSGLLAHPGGSEASAAHLVVECSPSARAGVAATKKATHLEALLRIHLRHSRTALGAQAAAWELLHVLFGRLEGEVGGGGPGEAGCGAEDAPDADGLGARDAPDADGLGARDAPLRLLVDLRRRAALSDWLRDRARAGAGNGEATSRDVAAQREVWRGAGFEPHLDATRALCYALHDHEVRLARLLEAGAWREAHDVLCAHVAAGRLLAGGGEEGGREAGVGQAIHAGTGRGPASPRPTFAAAPVSLSHALETLAPHATAIDGWEAGAGAYVRHLALRAAHVGQARSTGGGSDGAEALRGARVAQAAALAAAQERWGLAGAGWSAGRAGRGDAARRQAALALMASELGGWELADGGEAAPAPAQALAAAQLPAQTGLRLSCSVQLAAAALAERWSEPA
ncbi:Nuclear pore complex protein Nup98-Nup96 [Auxenochlorella protothecoides]|uniref:Nuclear pore complex protein Nup98-Nup96 n=1 Tax=Auxenochlorella protothecoides TaxID=3075 RepID=A0A087SKW7_AUXPR|nr:Nuclear pore complex protein Nup98-Nup96 [Auxenochlorella protothecoides]KFM26371.1 Nuclear pore complex protein Nup98-Nup96 [Auxenochlorella protothecoides]